MALLNVPKGQTLWVLAVGKGRLFFLPPAKLVPAPKVDLILIPRRDSVHLKCTEGRTPWVSAVRKGRLFFSPPPKLVPAPKVDLILGTFKTKMAAICEQSS